MIHVNKPEDIPLGEGILVIVFKETSVYTPGDERSRQCPGHGYSGSADVYKTPEILLASSEDDLRQWIEHRQEAALHQHRTLEPYAVLRGRRLAVTIRAAIEIG